MPEQDVPVWLAIIVSFIGAGATYLFKVFLPARDKRLQAQIESELADRRDNREYHQATETDAFKQVLLINETLIKTLIQAVENKADLENMIQRYSQANAKTIADANTQIEIANRDRVRLDEIISDIDVELHAIKEVLKSLK